MAPTGSNVLGGTALVMGMPRYTSDELWQTAPVCVAVAGVNSNTSWAPTGTFELASQTSLGWGAVTRRARATTSAASAGRLEILNSSTR